MLDDIKLKISTPTGPLNPGRGFYQLEDESLFVQLGLHYDQRRYFNHLYCENLHLDIDRMGQLMFIEANCPKRHWIIDSNLKLPKRIETADIRWMNFRKAVKPPLFKCDISQKILKLEFSHQAEPLFFYLAENVVAETNANYNLSALWVTNITDDKAGQNIKQFRRKARLTRDYFQK